MKYKRESFLNLIINIISTIISSVFFMVLIRDNRLFLFGWALITVISIFAVIIQWIFKRYKLENDIFYVKSGVFNKKTIKIPKENIIGIDSYRTLKQKIVRLNMFKINTQNTEEDIQLVLSNNADKELKELLLISKKHEEAFYKMSLKENIIFSITNNQITNHILAVITLLMILWTINNAISLRFILDNSTYIALFILGFIVLEKAIVIFINFRKHIGFKIVKTDTIFKIETGLLVKKSSTLNIKRVSAISINQSLLLRMLNKCTISVSLSGIGEGDESNISVIYPIIDKDKAKNELKDLFPSFNFIGEKKHISKKHKIRYKNTRYAMTKELVYLESGIFTKKISIIKAEDIDSIQFSQNIINKMKNTYKLKVKYLGNKSGDLKSINGLYR